MIESAKFILSKSKVLEQFKIVKNISDQVSYSFKTNYEVGKVLEELTNCKFSVHSMAACNELKDKSRIWFFAQGWNPTEINSLLKSNVTSFVVDNLNDLNLLLGVINTEEIKINLLLRMRLKEHTIHTGKHFVFGLNSSQINELIPILKRNKKIQTLGIHFHRKTQNIAEWSIKEELQDSLSQETLNNIDTINIGGGIPCAYKNQNANVITRILEKIKEFQEYLKEKKIQMVIEPGRFIAAPSVKLAASVINIYYENIIINCSVYNSAMDTFIAQVRLMVENESEKGTPFTIKGCTPDSVDIFRYRVYLQKTPKIGDRITFVNAGAYNFSTEFCKLSKLVTEVIE